MPVTQTKGASTFRKTAATFQLGAKTLPQRNFVSPEIFAQELQKIFATKWVLVGHQSQLAEAGDYFLAEVAGESLIVAKDQRSTIRAFYNVCRHRGARLCEEQNGHTAAIQCSYHAWTYALDGRLLGAPHMDETPGFNKAEYPLKPARLGLWEGFIFVNLADSGSLTSILSHPHSSALTGAARPSLPAGEKRERRNEVSPSGYKSLEDWFVPLAGKFSRWNLPTLRSAKRIEYDVRANWKLMFQNYSECYHCLGVHPELSKISRYDSAENDLTKGPFLGGFMRIASDKSLTLSGNACALPVGNFGDEDFRFVFYYSIFPNMLLSLHPDYVMVHQLEPQSPERTLILCDWFFNPDAAGVTDPGYRYNPDDAIQFWDMINKQDWRVCELSQQGISSRAYEPGPYSARESIPAAWDKYYLRQME
jgi:Rieske 2Fe-2S family protein